MNIQPGQQNICFHKFRYQILPNAKDGQLSIFSTIEELKQVKNKLFADVLLDPTLRFYKNRGELSHKIVLHIDEFIIFKIGIEKLLNIENSNFEPDQVPTYPNVYVIVDNRPDQQWLYIEKDKKAFTAPEVVANALALNFNRLLRPKDLAFFTSPVFTEKSFWGLVEKYQNQIEAITFEFIRPNMANISQALDNDLKVAQSDLNSTLAKLEFKAPPKGTLDITPENETVRGLVEYNSNGGGPITFKAKNIRQRVSTNNSNVTFEIKDSEITGNATDVANFLKLIGKDGTDG